MFVDQNEWEKKERKKRRILNVGKKCWRANCPMKSKFDTTIWQFCAVLKCIIFFYFQIWFTYRFNVSRVMRCKVFFLVRFIFHCVSSLWLPKIVQLIIIFFLVNGFRIRKWKHSITEDDLINTYYSRRIQRIE